MILATVPTVTVVLFAAGGSSEGRRSGYERLRAWSRARCDGEDSVASLNRGEVETAVLFSSSARRSARGSCRRDAHLRRDEALVPGVPVHVPVRRLRLRPRRDRAERRAPGGARMGGRLPQRRPGRPGGARRVRPRGAARRDGAFASVRPLLVRGARRRYGRGRGPGPESPVLGLHDAEPRAVFRSEGAARRERLLPGHGVGQLAADDRGEANPSRPARRRLARTRTSPSCISNGTCSRSSTTSGRSSAPTSPTTCSRTTACQSSTSSAGSAERVS